MPNPSLLTTFQKLRVAEKRKAFCIDHFGEMWDKSSDDHKRFLARAAFLQADPVIKNWHAYSQEDQSLLHSFGLWAEEFADFQKAIKNRSKAFEKRLNQAD